MSETTWSEEPPAEDFDRMLDPDGSLQGEAPNVDDEELRGWLRTFLLTRTFEDKMLNMQRSGEISLVARSRGEEATPLGAAAALESHDWIFYTYRQTPALLYWDMSMAQIAASHMGHAPETVAENVDSENPPVNVAPDYTPLAVNLPNGVGAAMADDLEGNDNVSLVFIGDGSTSEGDFHDGMNFAGVFDAPTVIVCQNNQWAISEPTRRQTGSETFAQKAEAYGMPHERVDGNDVFAVHEATERAVERARDGEGPTFIECVTYRMGAHNTSDNPDVYREDGEQRAFWEDRDPVDRLDAYLRANGLLDDESREEMEEEVEGEVEDAIEEARGVPETEPDRMFDHHLHTEPWKHRHQRVELDREQSGENPFTDFTGEEFIDADPTNETDAPVSAPTDGETEEMNLLTAVNHTLSREMERDETVRLLGYDIGPLGGVFRATEGLIDEFGEDRVIDTPLTENGIVGTSVGMAMRGDRPVPEIQFMGFFYAAFRQFMYTFVKQYERTGGGIETPMTLRLPYGGGIKALEYHQESTETFPIHVPGVRVLCPSSPTQAKGMLAAAIRDPDPAIFMEPKSIYRGYDEDVPTEEYTLSLDRSRVAREGSDVSLFAWGARVKDAMEAAENAEAEVEVIDLRTLSPLDVETILESVRKTGRCVVFHEARRTLGLGAELSALANTYALDRLKAPIVRASGYDVHFPGHRIEDDYLPDAGRAEHAIEAVMNYEF
jgi:pyruvate/2-oxoglutarate/acetoin dehydrogenase E1 component/TPP-dependent pyruvate/acetoin dehydrogenase alpha subunit